MAKNVPVYHQSSIYASEHGERDQYWESYRSSKECQEMIEEAILDVYNDNRLDCQAVYDAVCAEFDIDRIAYVLANTFQQLNWDGRISKENKQWAKSISIVPDYEAWGGDHNCYFVIDRVHIGLVDLFATFFREHTLQEAV